MAVIDAFHSAHNIVPQKQSNKKALQLQFNVPFISCILLSLIGWLCEALISYSLNLSNLLCLLIFLPVLAMGNKYDDIMQTKQKLHSKDLKILKQKTDVVAHTISETIEKPISAQPLGTDTDYVKRRVRDFVHQYFMDIIKPFLAQDNYIALRQQKLVTVDASNIVAGDVLFLKSGQKIPCDCQLLPSYSSQKCTSVSNDPLVRRSISYGTNKQPSVRTIFEQDIFSQLQVNSNKKNQINCFPNIRIIDAILQKSQTQASQDYLQNNYLYDDYLLFGYKIDKIMSSQPLYYFDFEVQEIAQKFTQIYNMSLEQVIANDLVNIIFNVLQNEFDSIIQQNCDSAVIGIKLIDGIYALAINVKSKTILNKFIQSQDDFISSEHFQVNENRIKFQRKATIPASFFTHLNSLQKSINKLPWTIFLSIIIIFIPHIIRLICIQSYSAYLQTAFNDTPGALLHGLVPTLCATLTFGISSLVFINNGTTLFRPIIKSASKYVNTLQDRHVDIPTLGGLEGLGFTNAIVVDINQFLQQQQTMETINIGCRTQRGLNRQYDKKQIKKFESVFSHRVLRPFYVVYSESETSTWLSFVRLIAGISLKNEEIYQILKETHNTKNIYCNDFVRQKDKQKDIDEDSEKDNVQRLKFTKYQKSLTQCMKVQFIINKQLNYPFFNTLSLHEFQQDNYCDFTSLIQPQCLQEALVNVSQCHPLISYPNFLYSATIPNNKFSIFVLRSDSLANLIPYCQEILSHSNHDLQSGIVSDLTSDPDPIHYEYKPLQNLGEANQIYSREICAADVQYLNDQEKATQLKCTNVVHYAIMISENTDFVSILQQKRFIYSFSIGFSSQINQKMENFLTRFKQNQLGLNLIISTQRSKMQCQSIIEKLGLQPHVPTQKKLGKHKMQVRESDPQQLDQTDSRETGISIQIKNKALKTPIINTKQIKNSDKIKLAGTCIVLKNTFKSIQNLTNYILTKSFSNKKHLLLQKQSSKDKKLKQKKVVETKVTTSTIISDIEEKQQLLQNDFENYLQVDVDSEMDFIPHKRIKNRKIERSTKQFIEIEDNKEIEEQNLPKILIKPETKTKQQIQVFIITDTNCNDTATQLAQQGLFVSTLIHEDQHQISLDQLIENNQHQLNQDKPDFMIINYSEQHNSLSVSEKLMIQASKLTGSRISICSISGKHALNRLLDVCQEIPYYLMTLSPVFLGTIRSRLMVASLPLFLLFAIVIIEFYKSLTFSGDIDSLQIRPWFYPPISCGLTLLFSVIYIEYILPLIIWTPPNKKLMERGKQPTYIGNRAAMLWDFNKLLPKKTSTKELAILSLVFFVSCLAIVCPAADFYFNSTTDVYLDDFITQQQLKLSPFVSIYYCIFFTSFTTGALLVANKLPLGQVWGQKIPMQIKVKKVLLFILIQILCLIVIFVLPTVSNFFSQVILGYNVLWSDNTFTSVIAISFSIGIIISVAFILEQVLFVRTG